MLDRSKSAALRIFAGDGRAKIHHSRLVENPLYRPPTVRSIDTLQPHLSRAVSLSLCQRPDGDIEHALSVIPSSMPHLRSLEVQVVSRDMTDVEIQVTLPRGRPDRFPSLRRLSLFNCCFSGQGLLPKSLTALIVVYDDEEPSFSGQLLTLTELLVILRGLPFLVELELRRILPRPFIPEAHSVASEVSLHALESLHLEDYAVVALYLLKSLNIPALTSTSLQLLGQFEPRNIPLLASVLQTKAGHGLRRAQGPLVLSLYDIAFQAYTPRTGLTRFSHPLDEPAPSLISEYDVEFSLFCTAFLASQKATTARSSLPRFSKMFFPVSGCAKPRSCGSLQARFLTVDMIGGGNGTDPDGRRCGGCYCGRCQTWSR